MNFLIGNLSEQTFVGYKKTNDGCFPIIIPNNIPFPIYDDNDTIDFSSGLSHAMKSYLSSDANENSVNYKTKNKYTIYLPQLKQLTNFNNKINIYNLIYKKIIFIDEGNANINIMLDPHAIVKSSSGKFICNSNLSDVKNSSKIYKKSYIYGVNRGAHLIPLMECVDYRQQIRKWHGHISLHKSLEEKYTSAIIEVEQIFIKYPLLKEIIQDLEYRYQNIIEPIILIDEESIHNYEVSISQTAANIADVKIKLKQD